MRGRIFPTVPLSLDLTLMSAPERPHPWTPLLAASWPSRPSLFSAQHVLLATTLPVYLFTYHTDPRYWNISSRSRVWVALGLAHCCSSPQALSEPMTFTECLPGGTPQSGEVRAWAPSKAAYPRLCTRPWPVEGRPCFPLLPGVLSAASTLLLPGQHFPPTEGRDVRNAQMT